MSTLAYSRNHNARPGYQLHDAIDLHGWEDQSIWGWDEGTGNFFAQLWRNGSSSDAPEIWLTGTRKPYAWPGCIALDIVEHTASDPLAVVQALGIAHPEPALRGDDEITGRIDQLKSLNDQSEYIGGQIAALAWTRGQAELTPSTRAPWDQRRPSAARADAEHHLITGRVYLGGDPVHGGSFFNGADEALWWTLGR